MASLTTPANVDSFVRENIYFVMQRGDRWISMESNLQLEQDLIEKYISFAFSSRWDKWLKSGSKQMREEHVQNFNHAVRGWLEQNYKDGSVFASTGRIIYPDKRIPHMECDEKDEFDFRAKVSVVFISKEGGCGVKAKIDLPCDTYLGRLTGVALSREERQVRKDSDNYLFNVASTEQDPVQAIDTRHFGNYTRFLKHSSEPNCEVKSFDCNGKLVLKIYTKKNVAQVMFVTFNDLGK